MNEQTPPSRPVAIPPSASTPVGDVVTDHEWRPGCPPSETTVYEDPDRPCTCERRTALAHPKGCSCAIPCRTCGHESEQHAGSLWGGTGPRRCRMPDCKCKGRYIGSTPARCKQAAGGAP